MIRKLRKLVLVLIASTLLGVSSVACTDLVEPAILFGQEVDGSVVAGGVERLYRVFVPDNNSDAATAPQPLVLALHGLGMNAAAMSWVTGFNDVARRNGFIVVYPEALEGNWNDGQLNSTNPVDDVAFIAALIDQLQATYRIDPKRIYVTGISKGGYMTTRLAVDLSDRIAAAAPVSAILGNALATDSTSGRPVPVMIIEGDTDPISSTVSGILDQFSQYGLDGDSILNSFATVSFWVERNHAVTPPVVTQYPDVDP